MLIFQHHVTFRNLSEGKGTVRLNSGQFIKIYVESGPIHINLGLGNIENVNIVKILVTSCFLITCSLYVKSKVTH